MQFKYVRAFTSLARRHVKTSHSFTETSHGKWKSDDLGGVAKSFSSCAVYGERRVIRNAEELTPFKKTLVVKSAVESHHPMVNRLFFFVSFREMEIYRKLFSSEKYVYIHGTLSIQQVMMINRFCGMVDRRKAFSLNSSQDHCWKS